MSCQLCLFVQNPIDIQQGGNVGCEKKLLREPSSDCERLVREASVRDFLSLSDSIVHYWIAFDRLVYSWKKTDQGGGVHVEKEMSVFYSKYAGIRK